MIITTQSGLAVVGPVPPRDSNCMRIANQANAARFRVGSPGGTISILNRAPFGALAVASVGPLAQAKSPTAAPVSHQRIVPDHELRVTYRSADLARVSPPR